MNLSNTRAAIHCRLNVHSVQHPASSMAEAQSRTWIRQVPPAVPQKLCHIQVFAAQEYS